MYCITLNQTSAGKNHSLCFFELEGSTGSGFAVISGVVLVMVVVLIMVVIDSVVGIRVHIGGSSLHSPDGIQTSSSLPSSAYPGKQLNMAMPPTVDLVITFNPFSGVSKGPHTTTVRDNEHVYDFSGFGNVLEWFKSGEFFFKSRSGHSPIQHVQ